ncbi:MAG: response regulator [Leptospiraceae bacterium]|nr:response regulator [Leptospiraceae bacterium]MCK6381030.1 response regulator [Leptospiraceae bacterium]NUM41430.1 response regulator [Leptospiraceae bacterium]
MKLNLLIVEDHEPIRELFQAFLGEKHNLEFASTGTEGLQLASEKNYDLIISDLNLPELEGLEMMQKLREKDINTPFVVITGHNTMKNELESFRLGALDFLVKPFGFDAISAILEKFQKNFFITEKKKLMGYHYLQSRKSSFILNSVMSEIQNYVKIILNEVENLPSVSKNDILVLKVILFELLANAIEHGNAGIGYDEKHELMKKEEIEYMNYIDSICAKSNKKVKVEICYSSAEVEVSIEDEGDGFDVESVPDPRLDPMKNLLSGRGIFITRLNIDSLTYNSKGNKVKAIRKLK